jgi:hypothetical protein
MLGPFEISGNIKRRTLNKAGKFQLRPEKKMMQTDNPQPQK